MFGLCLPGAALHADTDYDSEPLRSVVADTPDVPSAGGEVAWVPSQAGVVPPNAVLGGFDNENLYVGRAQHEGAVIPGKVVTSHGVCYIPWGGAEHGHPDYEVSNVSGLSQLKILTCSLQTLFFEVIIWIAWK